MEWIETTECLRISFLDFQSLRHFLFPTEAHFVTFSFVLFARTVKQQLFKKKKPN